MEKETEIMLAGKKNDKKLESHNFSESKREPKTVLSFDSSQNIDVNDCNTTVIVLYELQ